MEEAILQQIKTELITVEGGSFRMGSNNYMYAQPTRKVNVSTFLMAKHPVTQKIWKAVVGNNPSYFKGVNRPVETVSWEDICREDGFLNRLNEATKKHPDFQDGKKFRLPTEAQWEYTARGGRRGCKNNFKFSGSNDLQEVAWYLANSHSETKPIGLKLPNQIGLSDMSGNVWEWCADWWHSSYENAPKTGGTPWKKDGDKDTCVVRGGSWDFDGTSCRVYFRSRLGKIYRNYSIGFRLSRY